MVWGLKGYLGEDDEYRCEDSYDASNHEEERDDIQTPCTLPKNTEPHGNGQVLRQSPTRYSLIEYETKIECVSCSAEALELGRAQDLLLGPQPYKPYKRYKPYKPYKPHKPYEPQNPEA